MPALNRPPVPFLHLTQEIREIAGPLLIVEQPLATRLHTWYTAPSNSTRGRRTMSLSYLSFPIS